jgi:hypothetical protein
MSYIEHLLRRKKEIVLSEIKNNARPDGYAISIKSSGAVMKRTSPSEILLSLLTSIKFPLRSLKRHLMMPYESFLFSN